MKNLIHFWEFDPRMWGFAFNRWNGDRMGYLVIYLLCWSVQFEWEKP